MDNMKRDAFSSRLGFVISCIGSAVGMGNIWLFPARVSAYGGAFIIAYLIMILLISSTGLMGEMALGRYAGAGPVGAFGIACGKHRKTGEAIGLIPMIGALAMAIGYTVVMGWILKYAVGTFTGATLAPVGNDAYGAAFGGMASAFGNNLWQLFALILGVVILFFGVGGGIEKANKVMIPLFFLLFVGLAVYVAFQPGADAGYKYIFTVNPKMLFNPETWIYAMGQAFFSLSVAGNGTVIYGSYLDKKEDIPKSARNVAFFDTAAAFLAALVIIPAMATTGGQIESGGPGLMFVALPHLFSGMPGGHIVACVFFVAVLFAGLTSLINLYEAPIATLQEKFKLSRVTSCLLIFVIGAVISLCIQGIVSDWMDILSIYICPLGAVLAAIMFFWIVEKDTALTQINLGRQKPVWQGFYPLSKYVFVAVCLLVLVAGIWYGGIG